MFMLFLKTMLRLCGHVRGYVLWRSKFPLSCLIPLAFSVACINGISFQMRNHLVAEFTPSRKASIKGNAPITDECAASTIMAKLVGWSDVHQGRWTAGMKQYHRPHLAVDTEASTSLAR